MCRAGGRRCPHPHRGAVTPEQRAAKNERARAAYAAQKASTGGAVRSYVRMAPARKLPAGVMAEEGFVTRIPRDAAVAEANGRVRETGEGYLESESAVRITHGYVTDAGQITDLARERLAEAVEGDVWLRLTTLPDHWELKPQAVEWALRLVISDAVGAESGASATTHRRVRHAAYELGESATPEAISAHLAKTSTPVRPDLVRAALSTTVSLSEDGVERHPSLYAPAGAQTALETHRALPYDEAEILPLVDELIAAIETDRVAKPAGLDRVLVSGATARETLTVADAVILELITMWTTDARGRNRRRYSNEQVARGLGMSAQSLKLRVMAIRRAVALAYTGAQRTAA